MGFEVEIRRNLPVDYVLANGTKEQKAVIKMFDHDSNGIIDSREARNYNKYGIRNFGNKDNTVQIIAKGNKEAYSFTYNNLSDLDKFAIYDGALYLRDEAKKLTAEAVLYNANEQKITLVNGEQKQDYNLNTEY